MTKNVQLVEINTLEFERRIGPIAGVKGWLIKPLSKEYISCNTADINYLQFNS
ncbi:hypothetical protein [Limosilactobacillus reuteri]|uniref:hypothetical protein n=1 Tax=Limosilactobacillus reuteri TaxID=1598 RepID=UPI0017823DA4|nr:hypothetical protein [Limosilactobacillus reuteri]